MMTLILGNIGEGRGYSKKHMECRIELNECKEKRERERRGLGVSLKAG